MKKSFIVSGIALLVMLTSFIGYQLSPNYIAEDGTLVEAFGFIPLFWLALVVLVISLIVGFVLYKKN